MIKINDISKTYHTRSGRHLALNNVSFTVNSGDKIGILGRNGAGKSTLMKIISGAEKATSGTITRGMSVSWPISIGGGGLHGSLSGVDNYKFLTRIYDGRVDKEKLTLLKEMTELGKYLHEPIATYSSGMRARLSLAISLLIDFDCYIIDEALSVGDNRFQEKYNDYLHIKNDKKSIILVSHIDSHIKQHCDRIYVLERGILSPFDEPRLAFKFYEKIKSVSNLNII